MTEAPTIDTIEGRRWLVAARCTQIALLLEVMDMHADPLDEDEVSAFGVLQHGCELVGELALERDWCNEAGE